MRISFCAHNKMKRRQNLRVFPITKDLTECEISKACSALKDENFLGRGYNGEVFTLGQDLVIKKSRKDAFKNTRLINEAKKLSMLNKLETENGVRIPNIQRGLAEFEFPNGGSYLISTRIKGKSANFYTNPYTKRNLQSLLQAITLLDKGSSQGRLMPWDLSGSNINFTPNEAGIFDFEYLKGEPFVKSIRRGALKITNGNINNPHLSDTSGLNSNVRSFEWSGLHFYLLNTPKDEARKIFKQYLKLKSDYHKDMSKYFLNKTKNSCYKEEFLELAKRENAHAHVLSNPDNNLIKAVAMKIQMSHFIFKASHNCNCPIEKFNPYQISKYNQTGLNFMKSQFEKAKEKNNPYKMIYYKDGIETFERWAEIQDLPHFKINKMQKLRLSKNYEPTIDFLAD